MKIFGHPPHIMLIHFPSALFPMELVCYALFYYTGDRSFGDAAFYAVLGGAGVGWLAVLFGAWDLMKLSPDRPKVVAAALIHGSINLVVLVGFSVFAYATFRNYPELTPARLPVLIIKGALVLCLLAGNYLGGNLILRHKVGVRE